VDKYFAISLPLYPGAASETKTWNLRAEAAFFKKYSTVLDLPTVMITSLKIISKTVRRYVLCVDMVDGFISNREVESFDAG
jgi:hypothetical protein